jgi:hypothetical protein
VAQGIGMLYREGPQFVARIRRGRGQAWPGIQVFHFSSAVDRTAGILNRTGKAQIANFSQGKSGGNGGRFNPVGPGPGNEYSLTGSKRRAV